MNLHIPDVRILEVHTAPWNSLRGSCFPSPILHAGDDPGLPPLLHGVADASKLGFNFLNVAGVEPLATPDCRLCAGKAHRHGMLTSMITRSTELT